MLLLAPQGYRRITLARCGHRRSSQPWYGNDIDNDADDLAARVEALGLRNAIQRGRFADVGAVPVDLTDLSDESRSHIR